MTVRYYYGAKGSLTQNVSADAGSIVISSDLAGAIAATFVSGDDSTWLAIKSGNNTEVVQVVGMFGTTLSVMRGQEGTNALAWYAGTEVSFVLTAAAILQELPEIDGAVNISGSGLVNVNNVDVNNFEIWVDEPSFAGSNGITVTGNWANGYTIHYTPPDDDCCGTGSGGGSGTGITDLQSLGIGNAYTNDGTGFIDIPEPEFNTSGPITITGSWPSYTFTVSSGGGGTVTSVAAGAGIAVTGTPSVNPTVAIANTGVAAGTYAGVVINSRGQFTAVPLSFAPISVITATSPLHAARVAGSDTVALTVDNGAIGVKGVLELADPDDDFDPDDDTHAASPAVIAKALETLVLPSVAHVSNYTGETSSDYTNPVGSTTTSLILASGETALVRAMVTMVDGTTPLTPVAFGMAVIDATPSVVKANRKVTQNVQMMEFLMTGPVNTALTVFTTVLPAGATIQSYSFTVQKF